jgi:hypothetical protein
MIEWFDDLALGMRFKTGEVTVTTEDIGDGGGRQGRPQGFRRKAQTVMAGEVASSLNSSGSIRRELSL